VFAVGHLAFGYISSKTSAKLLNTNLNIPIALTLSVIPDIDILFSPFIQHRGPTHSIVMALIVFIPFFAIYRQKAIPYLVALTQHSLIGDYIVGQTQLLWPITAQPYGIGLDIMSQTNVTLELSVFLASITMMLGTKDVAMLLQSHSSNLILSIPTCTVLLPTLLSMPLHVPTWLIIPHLAYIAIFSASMIRDLGTVFQTT